MRNKFSTIGITILVILLTILCVCLYVALGACMPVTLVFLILKLCSVISWSWWYVFLPLIIGVVSLIILSVVSVLKEIFM